MRKSQGLPAPKAVLLVLTVCLLSCATAKDKEDEAGKAIIEGLPKTVAIMPFLNETEEVGAANQLRKTFYNHFSSKPYLDVELTVVDEKLIGLERSTGKSAEALAPEEVCAAMGCDGLIYGKLIGYTRVYGVLYSQFGVEAEVWLVDAKTGKELIRVRDSARYHKGDVPLTALGVVMTAVSTAINLREAQGTRVINELCDKLAGKIPAPPGMPPEERPAIKDVLSNVSEGPFGRGKILKVGLEGEPGMVAGFDIGGFKKGIPMRETKQGIYLGQYPVVPGDETADMPLIVYLQRPGGRESQWIEPSGLVTIDTTPPERIKGLRAKGFPDRVGLAWDAVKNTPDLKGYEILRSEQALTGYAGIGNTEVNSFEDRGALPETGYYYRVTAFDSAGNESEMPDPAAGRLSAKEPVAIGGELTRDTVLSGTYIVKGELIVPRGLTLTLLPGTLVMFEEGAGMKISGGLLTDAKDSPVEFIPSQDKKWKGVEVSDGRIELRGLRIRGAETALSILHSDGYVENSTIAENGTGILMAGFYGEVKDNTIVDNETNLSSESIVSVSANYFGAINTDEMRLKNIIVTKVYDRRPPEGRLVDAITNPYAALAEDERKAKAAGFLIEAGNYFRQRNFGKAATLFEEAKKAYPSPEIYYYLAFSYREMKEDKLAMERLTEGVGKFPGDSSLWKSLGMLHYESGNNAVAKKAFEEVLRLNPEDRQSRFMLERIGK